MYRDFAGSEYQPKRLAELRRNKEDSIKLLKLGRLAIPVNGELRSDTDPVYDRALTEVCSRYGRAAKKGDITNKAEYAALWDFFGNGYPHIFTKEYELGRKAIDDGTADMMGFNNEEFLCNMLGKEYVKRYQKAPYRLPKTS